MIKIKLGRFVYFKLITPAIISLLFLDLFILFILFLFPSHLFPFLLLFLFLPLLYYLSLFDMTKTNNETGKTVQQMKSTNASHIMPTPTVNDVADRQEQIEKLKMFLSNGTEQWDSNKPICRFSLPTGEYISCVCWNNTFYISGTDIIRALSFRFHAFGRPVTNTKKFEEGVFSDLRNLKSGRDATLEVPKSELLDLLYKFGCIRTQKKQKVFYWFSVPHDRLFLDALDRDLKREKIGIKSTTTAVAQPATLVSSDTIKKIFHELKSNLLLDKRTRSAPDSSRSLTSGNLFFIGNLVVFEILIMITLL
jgi:hypothetical protein